MSVNNDDDDKVMEKGEGKNRTDGLTTLLDQYMSLSITARTAAALSASATSKLPFIFSDSGSDNGPPNSVIV